MPRQSGRRPAVSRPAPRTSQAPSRPASTAAYPAQQQHHAPPPAATASQPAAAQSSQPGLFANMVSTAAGVAVGSTIGHTLGAGITSMFGGSSSTPAPAEAAAAPVQQSSAMQDQQGARTCEADARSFTRCLDENNGNMQICDWYLQQLKSCQEAARQY